MRREEKENLVNELQTVFAENKAVFLLDYRGLGVEQISDIRKLLREDQASMKVVKNRIAKLAVKDTPFQVLEECFVEPRAMVFCKEPAAPAKVLKKCLGELENLGYISGCIVSDGQASLMDLASLNQLGSLPSRAELLVKLLYVMQSPNTLLVRTLNEIPSKLVRILSAIAKNKGK